MLARQLIDNWFKNQHHIGEKIFHFHDPSATISYLNPDLFEYENVSIKVDLSSLKSRGQTSILPNKGNIKLATGIKKSKVKNGIYKLLNLQ